MNFLWATLFELKLEKQNRPMPKASPRRAASLAAAALSAVIAAPNTAHADFRINALFVDYGEIAIDRSFPVSYDAKPVPSLNAKSKGDIGLGLLPFVFVDVEGGVLKDVNKWSFDTRTVDTFNAPDFKAGPSFAGTYELKSLIGLGKLKYEVDYLLGPTTPAEQGTLLTRVQFQIPF